MNKKRDDVKMLFEYWKERCGHPRAKLDDKRRRKLRAALDLYDLDECKLAVDGCLKSPWHQGNNPRGRTYDQISLIFRDAEKIEMFIDFNEKPPRSTFRDEVDEIIERSRKWN